MSGIRSCLFFSAGILSCLFLSCRQTSHSDKKAEQIANLECRAITLRKQRFTLADKIRFTQDTLLHLKIFSDSIQLNQNLRQLTIEKDSILQASLRLADTIHRSLDSLRKYDFRDVNDKRLFDRQLEDILKKKGCDK